MMKKEKIYYVYEWFNTDTGEVFYVGSGHNNRYKDISRRNHLFKEYYNNHNCDVRKIEERLIIKEALKKEEELTNKYKNIGWCKCNIKNGNKNTDELKQKMSELTKKVYEEHPEIKQKISKTQKQRFKNPSERQKLSEAIKKVYEEHPEVKQKIKDNHADFSGKKNPFYGKKHTPESIQKMSKPIVQFTKDYKFIASYVSTSEAAQQTKINNITPCCKGSRKSAGGFIWMYLEDYLDLLKYAF